MRQGERDELLIEQRDMLASIAARLDRKERERERARRESFMAPLPRAIRHRPTWESFEKVVPDSHLAGDPPTVSCPCGAETTLTLRLPMMCRGDCGRAFVRVQDGPVRCHHFGNDEQEVQAA